MSSPDSALQRLFAERARHYAERRHTDEAAEAGQLRALTLHLGALRLAVPVAQLSGIVREARLQEVPGLPIGYLGLLNHRSRLVDVVSLAHLLAQQEPADATATLLLCRRGSVETAFAAGRPDTLGLLSTVGARPVTDPAWPAPIRTMLPDGAFLLDTSLLYQHPLFQEIPNP